MNATRDNTFDTQGNHAVSARARAVFASACRQTDSYHALRLGLARHNALAARRAHPALRVWAPLAGAAACCALAVGVVWMRPGARSEAPTAIVASSAPTIGGETLAGDTAPVLGTPPMEMVQDLSFYRWLAEQPGAASAAATNGH